MDMPNTVKKWYPEELFTYMENAFSLPEDICAPIKGCNNATNSKKSRKKKHSGARKLSSGPSNSTGSRKP
ncbi:hypothetical protein DICVIV_05812 [Dictyocaulus viviparus]|uniref:Uncharacterized protein n=1 Tax=Dictyocaulus viviparus TaxID=29172 RepID=A0A0D8Y0G9_DICVI|nr:hypothetical protein DICVIV_05812 [Dictyocaulus viviparus]